jgi:hypothetical protein
MAAANKSKPHIPLACCADDGWSKEDEATATCFCGVVQLAFVTLEPESACVSMRLVCRLALSLPPSPKVIYFLCSNAASKPAASQGPGLVDTFICNCAGCRKITASMFASNFTVVDTHLKHLRGRDSLKTFSQSRTISSGNAMTNSFVPHAAHSCTASAQLSRGCLSYTSALWTISICRRPS